MEFPPDYCFQAEGSGVLGGFSDSGLLVLSGVDLLVGTGGASSEPLGFSVFDGLALVLCFLILLPPPPTWCSVFLSKWNPWFSLFIFACRRRLLSLSPGSLNLLSWCLRAQLFYKLDETAKECISHTLVLGRGCERGV